MVTAVVSLILLGHGFAVTAPWAGAIDPPEKTLATFRRVFTDRADDAEIDVRTTRDGTVVVIHDGDLQDGKAVHVWTVNRIDAMECAVERGAANLITDQPAEALALRSSVLESDGSVWMLRNYDVTVSLGVDPATGMQLYPHRSAKVRYDVDCGAGRVALGNWQMFSSDFANGEIVWADRHHGLPAFTQPGTAEENAALAAACGTQTAAR